MRVPTLVSPAPLGGHGLTSLRRSRPWPPQLSPRPFLAAWFESRKLCIIKVVGVGSVWVNSSYCLIACCYVSKTALRFSAVSKNLMQYCASERRKFSPINIKLMLKSNLHVYSIKIMLIFAPQISTSSKIYHYGNNNNSFVK